jgi:molybdopterin-guanine dinucleotide biosynthesis protein A
MTLTALLLAGGESRRMSSDKATLLFAGEPLWARQVRALRELQPEALWLSARVPPAWLPPEIEFVPDEPPSRGPLSGIAAALRRLQTSHLLVLAIDLPQMTSEHLRKLRALARPACGVIPQRGNLFEPLCALYPAEAASTAQAALAGNDVSLRHFVKVLLENDQLQIHHLWAAEEPLYRNVNTPADLRDSEK